MAIRQNVKDVYQMKKSVWAVLFHNCAIADLEERHKFCPRTANGWYLYQADKISGKTSYRVKLDLPLAIKNVLLSTFCDLSSEELLAKCLHGGTQNNFEALNSAI